jgi:hypothetical protein
VQPCSRSVAPAAAANVLENGISTATRTHASTRCVRARTPHTHAAPKSSPARPPGSLAPCRPRTRCARRAPRANGWDLIWATSARRGCPSRTAVRRGPQSRGAVPSIGLAAGARIAQAPAPAGAPAQGACAAALHNGRGHGPQCLAAAPSRAAARRFNRSRAHIPGTGHNSRGSRPRLFFSASFGTTVIFFYPVTALSPLFACGAWSSHRGHSLAGLRLAFRCEPDLGPVLSAVLAHPVREVLPAAGGFQIRRSTRSVALPATARSPACAAARASLRRRTGLPGICGTAGLRRVRAVPSADCNELFNAGCRMETPQQGRPSKSAVTDFSRRSVAPRSQEPGLAHRCAGVDKECALVVPDRRTRLRVRLPTGRETLLSMLHARAGDAKLSSPRAVLCACTRVRAGRETRRSRPPTDHPQSLVIVASKSRSLL